MKRFCIDSKYEYCPNGNYWQDISGIFDNRIYLFCDCNKCKGKVYQLRPIEVTKTVGKEVVERARKHNEVDELRGEINTENVDKIRKLIEQALKD